MFSMTDLISRNVLKSDFAASYARSFRSGIIEEAFHTLHTNFFIDSYSTSHLIELILATGTESRGLPTIGNGISAKKEHAVHPVETFVSRRGWLRDRT